MNVPYQITAFMFLLSPFLVIWMVLSILINGKPSDKTFEEGYYYDDMPAKRGV